MVCMVLWSVTPWMSYSLPNFSFCLYVECVHMLSMCISIPAFIVQDNFVEPVLFFHIYVALVTSSGGQTCEAVSFTCSAISSALPYTLLGYIFFLL